MYRIVIEKRAAKFIRKQPRNIQARLLIAIKQLPEGDVKTLKGYDGVFRLRVGGFRILYTIDTGKLVIRVIDAGSRGEIYNNY